MKSHRNWPTFQRCLWHLWKVSQFLWDYMAQYPRSHLHTHHHKSLKSHSMLVSTIPDSHSVERFIQNWLDVGGNCFWPAKYCVQEITPECYGQQWQTHKEVLSHLQEAIFMKHPEMWCTKDSPFLAPFEFYSFQQTKDTWKGCNFKYVVDIQVASETVV
jgi:hypothetical protein